MATMLMPDGLGLHYEIFGDGPPLVLVHGGWSDVSTWLMVRELLAERFTVVMYDRRAHGASGPHDAPRSVAADLVDLAYLIASLGVGPVGLCGFSHGALIALRLAVRHPDMVVGVIGHEPAALGVLAASREHDAVRIRDAAELAEVRRLLESGAHARAAERFVDRVAFDPGVWASLPPEEQVRFAAHGPTFLSDLRDDEAFTLELRSIAALEVPRTLTFGGRSRPVFGAIGEVLAPVLPAGTIRRVDQWGHVPHISHPDEYVDVVSDLLAA
ncbi:alpha/beta hydrolase [Demequina sp. SYSU T00039]|uniref:Alpha/beta hydrolase n=1 Tax=Demequina lignilytica TaxID=3051663 RepID=A0AAW7MAF6_9MICO|nr:MULTISPECIES: alpha/beta hydrolase [unclassified Demequina]MDN4479075.1 alpha/beta hydrolase [Demequina sp. SYSU T00039-1]MDN4489006.1 alpha/beta hydrolase [Demequina sp. SYSU T00039]